MVNILLSFEMHFNNVNDERWKKQQERKNLFDITSFSFVLKKTAVIVKYICNEIQVINCFSFTNETSVGGSTHVC